MKYLKKIIAYLFQDEQVEEKYEKLGLLERQKLKQKKTLTDVLKHIDIDKLEILDEDENFKFLGVKEEYRFDDVNEGFQYICENVYKLYDCFIFSKKTNQFITDYRCDVTKFQNNLYNLTRRCDDYWQFVDSEGNFLLNEWKHTEGMRLEMNKNGALINYRDDKEIINFSNKII